KNVIFATATPISNTMTELWTTLRYIRPDLLQSLGVVQFDEFASLFGEVAEALEETSTGDFKMVERFANYVNGPELLTMWLNGADVVRSEDLDIPGIPEIKGGRPQEIKIPRSELLADYIRELKATREAWDNLSGREKRAQRHVPLVIFGQARQAAIDLRLVDSSMPDDPGSKTNRVVKEVFERWQATAENRGTQMVFAEMFQSRDRRFNLYEEIRRKLVDQGVPAEEVAIIHEAKNDAQRKRLFDRVRSGDVRILLGSTGKMGIGVDVPQRMTALHHVDAPIRPMDFEQRNGRIVRQGNKNPVVEILIYGVEQTLDSVTYQILRTKQHFISQILNGKIEGRSFEDPTSSSKATFEEMMAVLTGNPLVKERYGLENRLRNLEAQLTGYQRQMSERRRQVNQLEQHTIPFYAKEIVRIERLREVMQATFPESRITEATVEGRPVDRKDLAKTLDDMIEAVKQDIMNGADEEGRIRVVDRDTRAEAIKARYINLAFGKDVQVRIRILPTYDADEGYVYLRAPEVKYEARIKGVEGPYEAAISGGRGFMQSFDLFIRHEHGLADTQERLTKAQKNLAENRANLGKSFEFQDELKQTRERLAQVMTDLKAFEDEDKRLRNERKGASGDQGQVDKLAEYRRSEEEDEDEDELEGEEEDDETMLSVGEFVAASDGSADFGFIGEELARFLGVEPGPIRVYRGRYRHFTKKQPDRLDEIHRQGYVSGREFVEDVARNFNAVYQGTRGSFILVKRNGQGQMIYIELVKKEGEGFYSVRTAVPRARPDFFNEKTPLWEGAQSLQPPSGGSRALSVGQSSVGNIIAPGEETVKGANLDYPPLSRRQAGEVKALVEDVRGWLAEALDPEVMERVDVELKPVISLAGKNAERSLAEHGDIPISNILGATTFRRLEALVELAYGLDRKTLQGTAYHEAFHVVARWLLPAKEYARLVKFYGSEEKAANAFSAYAMRRKASAMQGGPTGMIRKIMAKLARILRIARNGLAGKGFTRPEDVFGRILAKDYRPHWGEPNAAQVTTTAFTVQPRQMSIPVARITGEEIENIESKQSGLQYFRDHLAGEHR
ncbi:MAG: hypothetical protein KKB20_26545, partial [Proteobacteria bacterium]|nr:hypothetical protein [Pseudomonadota bacterium]